MNRLRQLDIFPKFDSKFEHDARDRTLAGGLLSFTSLAIIFFLVVTEIRFFFSVESRHELFVDNTDLGATLSVFLNISFHAVPCDLMSIDAINAFGEYQEHIDKNVKKHRIDKDGKFIEIADELIEAEVQEEVKKQEEHMTPEAKAKRAKDMCSCYGAENFPGQCCKTCDDIKNLYVARKWNFDVNDMAFVQCAKERFLHAQQKTSHEGCNLEGVLKLKRVQGNIHLVPGRIFEHLGMHLHDLGNEETKHLNLSHTVHTLRFGQPFPGLVNPLDGHGVVMYADGSWSALTGEAKSSNAFASAAAKRKGKSASSASRASAGAEGVQGLAQPDVQKASGATGTEMVPANPNPQKPLFGGGKFQYFVKVVPTQYERLSASTAAAGASEDEAAAAASLIVETNQYSVTEHRNMPGMKAVANKGNGKGGQNEGGNEENMIPGVFILYDLSPIKVRIYEARPYDSIAHLLLQLCAVAGGVFTVAGLVDAMWYHGSTHIRRKMEMGKFT